jgi:hypothetical protein
VVVKVLRVGVTKEDIARGCIGSLLQAVACEERKSIMEGVLRAKQIEIVDDKGRTRASLGISEEEDQGGGEAVILSLYDKSGQPRVRACVEEVDEGDRASLDLTDEEGRTRASIRLTGGGTPGIYLLDKGGNTTHSIPAGVDLVFENGA